MALLFPIETLEGGSLPGSLDGADVNWGTGTVTIDATSKVFGTYSIKFSNSAEGEMAAYKSHSSDLAEIWITMACFIPSTFAFGISGYTGFFGINDSSDNSLIISSINDESGNLRLTFYGSNVAYTDSNVNLPKGEVFTLEVYIKKNATTGNIKVWLNNSTEGSPDYNSGNLNTGATQIRKVVWGKAYVPEAVSDYYMDNFGFDEETFNKSIRVLPGLIL